MCKAVPRQAHLNWNDICISANHTIESLISDSLLEYCTFSCCCINRFPTKQLFILKTNWPNSLVYERNKLRLLCLKEINPGAIRFSIHTKRFNHCFSWCNRMETSPQRILEGFHFLVAVCIVSVVYVCNRAFLFNFFCWIH